MTALQRGKQGLTDIPITSGSPGANPGVNNGAGNSKTIIGIAVSPGVAVGRPCFYHARETEESASSGHGSDEQQKSFLTAYRLLNEQLDRAIKRVTDENDSESAAIFSAHKMILDEIGADVINNISLHEISAATAIEQCFRKYADFFRFMDDGYLRERANDFDELRQLLINLLCSRHAYLACREYSGCVPGECALGNSHILVAGELTASTVIRIHEHTRGIVSSHCGINSHAAVIARSLRLPVVSGIDDVGNLIHPGDNLLVDGDHGHLVINPDESQIAAADERITIWQRPLEVVEPIDDFRVYANVDLAQDVTRLNQVRADGIGLYRTEYELLARDEPMDEEAQYELYAAVIEKMQGKPVYFRLFDLGSDKSTPWLDHGEEANPALGCRGARLLLERPELMRDQVRALARVSRRSPVNMIYPMITSLEQLLKLQAIVSDAISGLRETRISQGIMFEVPSACEDADELFAVIDFGRVGSNDLLQYLFACDRDSDEYDMQVLGNDPAIWRLLRRLVESARRAGKPLEVCGALADRTEFIPRLIDLGINAISTHCDNVAAARKAALQRLRSR